MEQITWVFDNWVAIMATVTGLMTVASAITALTPTPRDDLFVAKLYKVIEKVALVVGKAKEKPNE